MLNEERYTKMMETLRVCGSATVKDLSERLFVSPSTIRRDLQELQRRGLVRHSYGKAVLTYTEGLGLPIELRQQTMSSEKLSIGKKAAGLIHDGDTIFIDASSTALCITEFLEPFNHLTVVTNGLYALWNLKYRPNLTLYGVGGMVIPNAMAFTGQLAWDNLKVLRIDKCFFSTTGCSLDGRLLGDIEPAHILLRTALERSEKKIYLCDSSKIGKNYMLDLCGVEDVDVVISNADFFERVRKPENHPPELIRV